MPNGYEMTEHLQPQAFRCSVCGGLVVEKPVAYNSNAPKAACPCGGVRVVGAPFEVVTLDEREVEASKPAPVLVGVADRRTGDWACSVLVDEEASGHAVLDLHDDQRLIIDINPAPCQKVGAAHVSSFLRS